MFKLLLSWAILSAAFLFASKFLPGMTVKSTRGAITAAAIFGVLNTLVGWMIVGVLGIATLGLGFVFSGVSWFIASVILLKVTDSISDELTLESTGTAIAAAFIIAVVGTIGKVVLGVVF
jgi:uncharacterized membrane protein YvlD (DUF360 family)